MGPRTWRTNGRSNGRMLHCFACCMFMFALSWILGACALSIVRTQYKRCPETHTHRHTHTRARSHENTRNTRTGKHAQLTSPFASPNYAYASSAASTLNKHINIIKLHAINAARVCVSVVVYVCVCVFHANQPLTLALPPCPKQPLHIVW